MAEGVEMAIRSFADQKTTDIYHGENTKAARKINSKVWPHAQRRLTLLHAAKSTMDLNAPGLHFKSLKYDRAGYYSIRMNDQYRIIFKFENGDAFNVSLEDFHGRAQT